MRDSGSRCVSVYSCDHCLSIDHFNLHGIYTGAPALTLDVEAIDLETTHEKGVTPSIKTIINVGTNRKRPCASVPDVRVDTVLTARPGLQQFSIVLTKLPQATAPPGLESESPRAATPVNRPSTPPQEPETPGAAATPGPGVTATPGTARKGRVKVTTDIERIVVGVSYSNLCIKFVLIQV